MPIDVHDIRILIKCLVNKVYKSITLILCPTQTKSDGSLVGYTSVLVIVSTNHYHRVDLITELGTRYYITLHGGSRHKRLGP